MSREDVRERLERTLNSPYPTDGDIWNAILETFAAEFAELEEAREQVLESKFVTDATGEQLDRLGTIFDLDRQRGEPDSNYRARLQVALRAQLTSATVDEIRDVIAVLLDIDAADVEIEEPYDREPMHLNVSVDGEALDDAGIGDDEFISVVDTVVAIGVSVGLLIEFDVEEIVGVQDDVSAEIDTVQTAYVDDARTNIDTLS
ncbi:virus protein phiCh1-VP31 (plasmid) [Natrialba magadii ATCC 43099]|uniref:Virus protein phiCh1-VP31 n=3 Tax=root TaxID=1 RepID=D3T2H8_NATMM|nr:hypothetical protein [Natrialba magadii]YP_010078059.1 baseplate protein [Natrialba phage PhiCh1]ADD07787.1 virus protein phiCh1-VP31 [Natrialba magadii ATCC 43099]ELY23034.1 hypothetical protein C500_21260 [Natrialba magadii ATCC 43099]QBJ01210.1 uncharacterized protein PhiCh1_140 [Natrialba phage PhiCh1]